MASVRTTRSAHNLASTGVARLAIGSPEDVIVIDAEGAEAARRSVPIRTYPRGSPPPWAGIRRNVDGDWVYFTLLPSRIQVYRGYEELPGREVMQDGRRLA